MKPGMPLDTLIDTLASDVRPMRRHALGWRLSIGLIAGGVVTLALIAAALGFRPDLRIAMHGFAFWMKWGYTVSIGIAAIALLARLARPEPMSLRALWPLAVPVTLLAAVAVGELASTPVDAWLAMWLGKTWMRCPWLVLMLAMPIFAGLLWSFQRLAPTRLRSAGAAAGLAAGAWGATLYCLHCPEVSALFVLTWYSLGILLATSFGALVGPRLLRW